LRALAALRNILLLPAGLLKACPALELFAEELRLAQQALGEITGEFTADDLLGVIFSRFCIGNGLIGFYDGFFGPGTGSFLIFLFVRFFGFDFLHASASAKLVNVATNLAALAYFVPNTYLLPLLAVGMALANFSGSLAGTWLALKHGSEFVRAGYFSCMLVY
jgi:uncharacterized membrane protein YfcA